MCLILFSVDPTPDCHLVVAANRDEQHGRATAAASFWSDEPKLLAGRDLVAGGTWLGVTTNGRFAAVTNFAEVPADPLPPKSRGLLTTNFLNSETKCEDYLDSIDREADLFRGFNLLISDGTETWYYSNQSKQKQRLEAGSYGLSNQLLDCDWPKVGSGRTCLEKLLGSQENQKIPWSVSHQLFGLLADQGDATPHSARFILGDTYGTSVSTVVMQHGKQTLFEERRFNPAGNEVGRTHQDFSLA